MTSEYVDGGALFIKRRIIICCPRKASSKSLRCGVEFEFNDKSSCRKTVLSGDIPQSASISEDPQGSALVALNDIIKINV